MYAFNKSGCDINVLEEVGHIVSDMLTEIEGRQSLDYRRIVKRSMSDVKAMHSSAILYTDLMEVMESILSNVEQNDLNERFYKECTWMYENNQYSSPQGKDMQHSIHIRDDTICSNGEEIFVPVKFGHSDNEEPIQIRESEIEKEILQTVENNLEMEKEKEHVMEKQVHPPRISELKRTDLFREGNCLYDIKTTQFCKLSDTSDNTSDNAKEWKKEESLSNGSGAVLGIKNDTDGCTLLQEKTYEVIETYNVGPLEIVKYEAKEKDILSSNTKEENEHDRNCLYRDEGASYCKMYISEQERYCFSKECDKLTEKENSEIEKVEDCELFEGENQILNTQQDSVEDKEYSFKAGNRIIPDDVCIIWEGENCFPRYCSEIKKERDILEENKNNVMEENFNGNILFVTDQTKRSLEEEQNISEITERDNIVSTGKDVTDKLDHGKISCNTSMNIEAPKQLPPHCDENKEELLSETSECVLQNLSTIEILQEDSTCLEMKLELKNVSDGEDASSTLMKVGKIQVDNSFSTIIGITTACELTEESDNQYAFDCCKGQEESSSEITTICKLFEEPADECLVDNSKNEEENSFYSKTRIKPACNIEEPKSQSGVGVKDQLQHQAHGLSNDIDLVTLRNVKSHDSKLQPENISRMEFHTKTEFLYKNDERQFGFDHAETSTIDTESNKAVTAHTEKYSQESLGFIASEEGYLSQSEGQCYENKVEEASLECNLKEIEQSTTDSSNTIPVDDQHVPNATGDNDFYDKDGIGESSMFTVSRDGDCKPRPIAKIGDYMFPCFKWKYTPSCDQDGVVPTSVNLVDDKPPAITRLPIYDKKKPIRIGLSKRHRTSPSLHPYYKK